MKVERSNFSLMWVICEKDTIGAKEVTGYPKGSAYIVKKEFPDIIVDAASGWYDMGCGDLKSIHWYFFNFKYKREKQT